MIVLSKQILAFGSNKINGCHLVLTNSLTPGVNGS